MSLLNTNYELNKWLGISLAMHILVIIIIASAASRHSVSRTFYLPAYKVDLVALEKPKPAASEKKKPAAARKQVTKKAKPIIPERPRAGNISVNKKPPAKKTVKKEAVAPDPYAAIASLRKKHEAELAVENIRERLEARQPTAPEKDQGKDVPALAQMTGVRKVSMDDMDRALKEYYDMLWDKIRRSWVLSGSGSFEGLEVIVAISIARSGKLLDVYVEKGSGNSFYDQSAIRAVRKAAPYPPLPGGYEGGMEVGFRFKPL